MEPRTLVIWALLKQAAAALQNDANHCPEDARILVEAASEVLVDADSRPPALFSTLKRE